MIDGLFFLLSQPSIQVVLSEHTSTHTTTSYVHTPRSKSTRTRLRDITAEVYPCETSTILKIIGEKLRWETWDEQASNSRPVAHHSSTLPSELRLDPDRWSSLTVWILTEHLIFARRNHVISMFVGGSKIFSLDIQNKKRSFVFVWQTRV